MKKKILIMIAVLVVFGFYVSGDNNYKEVKVINNNYYAPDFNVKEGNYFIDDKYIKAVSPKTKKSDFVNHFEFYEGSSNLKCNNGTDYVGTGCSLQSKGSTSGSDWNDVIITGDIDGNGINSITDIVKIAMHAKEKEKLTGAYAIAGDVDYDSELLLKDSSRLASYVIGDVEIPLPKETTHKNVIHLYDDSILLVEGGTKDIKYSVSKKGVTISSFVSENTAVATVSTSGKVTAKKAGSTNIKITASNGDVKTLLVNVTDEILPTGVSLSNDNLSLKINDTKTLTATVSPVNATNKSVKWSSSNSDIVSVDSNGKLTAKGVGTATITVTTVRGGKTATCKVTVYIPVTGVSLNKTSLTVDPDETSTLIASVQPNNATNKNVIWSSSNSEVASVDSNGTVVAKKAGTTVITAKTEDGSFKSTCNVVVNNVTISVTGITLNKSSLSLSKGGSETLSATVSPDNATNKNVIWSSSDNNIASVDSNGKVTAKLAGTVNVTATTKDGSFKATCKVDVKVGNNGYTVLINPSHQVTDRTITGSKYPNEKASMFALANVLKTRLENNGYTVFMTPDNGNVEAGDGCFDDTQNTWGTCGYRQIRYLINKSNTSQTIYLALHSNMASFVNTINPSAGSGPFVGPMVLYKDTKASTGGVLASNVCDSVRSVYSNNNMTLSKQFSCPTPQQYYEPNMYYDSGGMGIAILLETGFHDNPVNQKFIEDNHSKISDGIIVGINKYFGL